MGGVDETLRVGQVNRLVVVKKYPAFTRNLNNPANSEGIFSRLSIVGLVINSIKVALVL